MAKILFINMPAHGHANPTFPLVSALVKAGHTVDYLITEEFRKKVEHCGAKLIPYFVDNEELLAYQNLSLFQLYQSVRLVKKFYQKYPPFYLAIMRNYFPPSLLYSTLIIV